MSIEWFRWWHGTVSDPKFGLVAKKSKTSTANVVAVWAFLLEKASSVTQCDADVTQCDNDLSRGDVTTFNSEVCDYLLGIDEGLSQSIFDNFEKIGLVKNGRILKWETRQPKREDSSAERTKRWREGKKIPKNNDDIDSKNDACDADVTQCDATRRLDREIEEEKDLSILYPPTTAHDDFTAFKMFPAWKPSPHIDTIASVAGSHGITKQDGYSENLGEFIAYWLSKKELKTQGEWDHALIKSLKHTKMNGYKTKPQAETKKPSSTNRINQDFSKKQYTGGKIS